MIEVEELAAIERWLAGYTYATSQLRNLTRSSGHTYSSEG